MSFFLFLTLCLHFISGDNDIPGNILGVTRNGEPYITSSPPTFPDGYVYSEGIGVHKLYNSLVEWSEALKICMSVGGNLAVINSEAEASLLKKMYKAVYENESIEQHAHMGIFEISSQGNWVTVDGTPLADAGYAVWHRSIPNNGGSSLDCGSLHLEGGYLDCSCGITHPFFCEIPIPKQPEEIVNVTLPEDPKPTLPEPMTGPKPSLPELTTTALDHCRNCCALTRCPMNTASHCRTPLPRIRDDYEVFNGIGAFKIHTHGVKWSKARTTCMDEGGNLAVINSKQEALMLKYLYEKKNMALGGRLFDSAYIGVHDLFSKGDWVTVHGNPLDSAGYTNWTTKWGGQPDNRNGSQDCVVVLLEGGINDVDCQAQLPFICEIPITYQP